MRNNREINLGSFEKTALFHELDVYDFLNERKGKIGVLYGKEVKIGLGSKVLLKNLLLLLKEKKTYDIFRNRFLKMAKEIFADDMIIAIKNDLEMDLYFIKREDFFKLFKENIDCYIFYENSKSVGRGNSITGLDRRGGFSNA